MKRYLRNGGQRKKALFGADGAIMGAATLAAAAIQAAATNRAAREQASSIMNSAKTQANSIREQTRNNNSLQRESIAFTRQQNNENRDQQQEIQATLQMMAGQENMNDRFEKTKVALKYGGRAGKRRLRNAGNLPFTVTDGGGVIPLNVNADGYGLYEIFGNDHEHYHKTKSGKAKTGVGFKFSDGSVVEGEGNQNSSTGEKLFVTPNDAMFISKHSINGFNPSKAIDYGMNPLDAFSLQEYIKALKGYNDDGSKKRKHAILGNNIVLDNVNQTQYPSNGTVNVAGGSIYLLKNKPSLKYGGRIKAQNGLWNNPYFQAGITGTSNLIGAGISTIGNNLAGRALRDAYRYSSDIIADAYRQMRGIDMSNIDRESFSAPHAMAVIRSADTNINPQLERLRRNATSEKRNVNRSTLSSAARQNRLAGINDRMYQRIGEAYADKYNKDEAIKRENASAISRTSMFNAQQDLEANKEYASKYLELLRYNNDIRNESILGQAQALSEGNLKENEVRASTNISNAQSWASAIGNTGLTLSNNLSAMSKYNADFENAMLGSTIDGQINLIARRGDRDEKLARLDAVRAAINSGKLSSDDEAKYKYYEELLLKSL